MYIITMMQQPSLAYTSSLTRILDNTQTLHTQYESSGRVISPSQRPLPDNTQHSTQTDIHALVGIQIRTSNKPAAADPRQRPRGHWDRRAMQM